MVLREQEPKEEPPIKTTIEITRYNWTRLNSLKKLPGDSFNDVIQRLLDEKEA